MILPEIFQQSKSWEIPATVKYLMIPIRENNSNSVLIFVNPIAAYELHPTVHSCMILVYSGISLSLITNSFNQYNLQSYIFVINII